MSAVASTSAVPLQRAPNDENDDSVLRSKIMNTLTGVVAGSLEERRSPLDVQLLNFQKENVQLWTDNQNLSAALEQESQKNTFLSTRLDQLVKENSHLAQERDTFRANCEQLRRERDFYKQATNSAAQSQLSTEHANTPEELQRHKSIIAEVYQRLQQHESAMGQRPQPMPVAVHLQSQIHPMSSPAHSTASHQEPGGYFQQPSPAPLQQPASQAATHDQLLVRQQRMHQQQMQQQQIQQQMHQQQMQRQQQQQREITQQQQQRDLQQHLQMARQEPRQSHLEHEQPIRHSAHAHPNPSVPLSAGHPHNRSRPGTQHGPPTMVQTQSGIPLMPRSASSNERNRGFMVMPERGQPLMIDTTALTTTMMSPPLSAPATAGSSRHAMGMPTPPLSAADRRTFSHTQVQAAQPMRQQPLSAGATPRTTNNAGPPQIRRMQNMHDVAPGPQPTQSSPQVVQRPSHAGHSQQAMQPQQPMEQSQFVQSQPLHHPTAPQYRPFVQQMQQMQPAGQPPQQPIVHSNMADGFRPMRQHDMSAYEATQRAALGLGPSTSSQPMPAHARRASSSSVPISSAVPGGQGGMPGGSVPSPALRRSSYDPSSPIVLGPSVASLKRPNGTTATRDPAKRQRTSESAQSSSAAASQSRHADGLGQSPRAGGPVQAHGQRFPPPQVWRPTAQGQMSNSLQGQILATPQNQAMATPQAQIESQQRLEVDAYGRPLQHDHAIHPGVQGTGGPSDPRHASNGPPSARERTAMESPRDVSVKREAVETALMPPPPFSPLAQDNTVLHVGRQASQPIVQHASQTHDQQTHQPDAQQALQPDAPQALPFEGQPAPPRPDVQQVAQPVHSLYAPASAAHAIQMGMQGQAPIEGAPQQADTSQQGEKPPQEDVLQTDAPQQDDMPQDAADDINRDADGLQIETDCVSKIVIGDVEGDWEQVKECESCRVSCEMGSGEQTTYFSSPTYEELLAHCTTHHSLVWDDVRKGIF